MKLVLQEFLSLDGVSQGPGSPEEDVSGGFTRGGWFVPFADANLVEVVTGWIGEADAFLFGHLTYVNFARDWPAMDNPDDPVATSLNHLPKYVAARSAVAATWAPTTVLSEEIEQQVGELKRQGGREIQIHGSARLGWSLLAAGLIDEVRLAIAPVVVGQGRRLFQDGGKAIGMELLHSHALPSGLAIQILKPLGEPSFGTFGKS